ncbi:hypothetical protein [Methylobacterium soli]|jgi:hypothetical protein|uniref:Uncharacterized protein n=1 Tax=Methylobacterium soli TaxID=553447 RepID=A0A6L3T0B9_9HYPH|nr:hypothetical protein [Methylobacterium soli]KAB1079899.1 hypothetical protein F6X53_09105 [Methylobacterium soli]GJE41898.1 hypothetical protein AEGHOMDF_1068 [Methylobacterium soli]
MRPGSIALLAALAALVPVAAQAGSYGRPAAGILGPEIPITLGGRAPWDQPWEYDSGGDNDRRPELEYYQQGRGQQTGGPARNLLPDDGLHLFPR